MGRISFRVLLSAALLPSLWMQGTSASPAAAPASPAVGGTEFASKMKDLLKSGTWCHKGHSPVGFVLNYFDFEDHAFRSEEKYVSDEGTTMRDVVSSGSWSLTVVADRSMNVHFDVVDVSDADAPRLRDLNLKVVGETKITYQNGDKLELQERNSNKVCF